MEQISDANDKENDRESRTRHLIERFQAAFNHHDVDTIMAAMAEDCVFENTYPAPDGSRVVGHSAVRATWEEFFAASPQARFDTEELIICGERAVVRWRYSWGAGEGERGHVRGVDIFRVRDGKVAEKLSYVKG
jgi:ketosteroid isomerase-like protein